MPITRVFLVFLVFLVWVGQQDARASISVSAQFEERLLPSLDVELFCGEGHTGNRVLTLTRPGRHLLQAGDFESPGINCQVTAHPPNGYTVAYTASGDSSSLSEIMGCRFVKIGHGQANDCQVRVTQDAVSLTVYKKWIGGSGEEEDVRVSLECESGEYSGYRYVNEGKLDGWEIRNIDFEGILCNVSETVRDNFRPDIIDCQGLYILPGKGEECTLLNTKIVKRIEMLNRYGKLVMILLVLAVGLVAVKRFT